MRILIIILTIFTITAAKAQTVLPADFVGYNFNPSFMNKVKALDTTAKQKWFINKYAGLSTSFSFFNGGSATVFSAPLGIQLNRKLNNNLFAFAGVSVAPAYVNFRSNFMNADFKNSFNKSLSSNSLGIYSRAELGLQYVNDNRTWSISGSIGFERRDFQMPGFNQSRTIPFQPMPALR